MAAGSVEYLLAELEAIDDDGTRVDWSEGAGAAGYIAIVPHDELSPDDPDWSEGEIVSTTRGANLFVAVKFKVGRGAIRPRARYLRCLGEGFDQR